MNFLDSLIPSSLAEPIGLTFMHAIWQLAAVALLLLLVLQVVPRKASRTRYLLGVSSLAIMPLLALGTFLIVYQPAAAPEPMPDVSAMISSGQILELEQHFAAREANMSFFGGISDFFNQNSRTLFALWALGSLLFAMRFLLGYAKVQRLRKHNTLAVPAEIENILSSLREKLGIRRTVQILQSGSVNTPMVIGALRPVVLLPLGLLSGLSPDQVECILAHELAHIRRRDYLINIFQSMVEIVFFFHPAVWWVSKLVREERENCCDETVLALKNDNIVYARALLNLETMRTARPGLAMASNGGSLFKRIKRITGAEASETRFYSRGLFVAMLTFTLVLVLSASTSEEIKASSPMMPFNDPTAYTDPGTPQTTPPAEKKEEEAKKEERCTETTRSLPLMDKILAAVAAIPNQVSLAMDGNGQALQRFMDEAIFEGMLAELNSRRDTPVTKLTLLDGGKEIVMDMDRDGNLEKVTVDGKPAPKEDYDKYKRMASKTFRQYLGKDPMASPPSPPSMPSMPNPPAPPSMAQMPNMPPIPAVPSIGKIPTPPAPPAKGNMSDKEYKKVMEDYEKTMEKWGEQVEKQFESGDWKRFEEEMEAWGEAFGQSMERSVEGQDWEAFGEKMEQWGEEFAKNFNEEGWEKFGEEMGRWGEELARSLEEGLDGLAELDEATANAARIRSGVDQLNDELVSEGLIDDGDAYRIKINKDELFVNGNKQSPGLHRRFKQLIEDDLGVEVEDEWVEINKKKGSVKINQD